MLVNKIQHRKVFIAHEIRSWIDIYSDEIYGSANDPKLSLVRFTMGIEQFVQSSR